VDQVGGGGDSCQLHIPTVLSSENDSQNALYRILVCPQIRSGHRGEDKNPGALFRNQIEVAYTVILDLNIEVMFV
jgi:hypothetical protein